MKFLSFLALLAIAAPLTAQAAPAKMASHQSFFSQLTTITPQQQARLDQSIAAPY
jgi:ABC-type Fe2+-enterobactin transport system substrate-binding protein